MTDFAHTEAANAARRDKAKQLARHLHDQGVSALDAVMMGVDDQKAHEKAAALRTSHRRELWDLVIELLEARRDWDAARAQPPAQEPETPAQLPADPARYDEHLPPDLSAQTDADQPVIGPGWDLLVALGPLERRDALCFRCGARAVAGTPDGWRCGDHPPEDREWGVVADWSPRTGTGYCAPKRCYCGRCPSYEVTWRSAHLANDFALNDQRAVLSGKRRSNPRTFAEARLSQEARQARANSLAGL